MKSHICISFLQMDFQIVILDEEYQKTCKDYLQMLQGHGADTVQANLKNWLTETSELGCGDDITVVMVYFAGE